MVGVGGGGGWEEKWGLKLTSAKVEVEVEAELGNITLAIYLYGWVGWRSQDSVQTKTLEIAHWN